MTNESFFISNYCEDFKRFFNVEWLKWKFFKYFGKCSTGFKKQEPIIPKQVNFSLLLLHNAIFHSKHKSLRLVSVLLQTAKPLPFYLCFLLVGVLEFLVQKIFVLLRSWECWDLCMGRVLPNLQDLEPYHNLEVICLFYFNVKISLNDFLFFCQDSEISKH